MKIAIVKRIETCNVTFHHHGRRQMMMIRDRANEALSSVYISLFVYNKERKKEQKKHTYP